MSEIRQDLATRNWVIIAPERLKGKKFAGANNPCLKTFVQYDKTCPFCPGNEERFPNIEVDRIVCPDNSEPWQALCIENKYKIMGDAPECPMGPSEFDIDGIYHRFMGCGNHELIIESPYHNRSFALMTVDEVIPTIELYVRRYTELGKNPNNLITLIFKNHGPASGASQRHPHSQIVASRIVPNYVRSLVDEARRYFDNEGVCVYCKIINFELKEKKRIVYENDHFVTLSPYAAPLPFQLDIYPKQHESDFRNLDSRLIASLGDCLQVTMKKLYIRLGNPDFNIIFRNPPYQDTNVPYCHWFVQIGPHCITPGGFEIGSRMHVNVIPPEQAAAELREV
jgi:UDPglucose--hexose-1-phosphate uridylyltransferase